MKIAPHNFVKDLSTNNQNELKFTYNEAYELITNGWVYKRGLHNKEGEAYNTWAGAIVNENNQTEIRTYHDKYGYKQENSIKALPVVNYRPEDTLKLFDRDEMKYKNVPLTIDLAYSEMEKGKSVPLRVMFIEEVENRPVAREILVSANAYPPAKSHNLYAEGVSVGKDLTDNFKQYSAKYPELYKDLLYPLAPAVQEKKDNTVGVSKEQQVDTGQKQTPAAKAVDTSSEKKNDTPAENQRQSKAERTAAPAKTTGTKNGQGTKGDKPATKRSKIKR